MRWLAAAPRSVCGARGTPAGGWRASTKGKAPAGGSGLFQRGKPLAGGRGAIPFRRLNRRRHIRFHQWTRPGSSPYRGAGICQSGGRSMRCCCSRSRPPTKRAPSPAGRRTNLARSQRALAEGDRHHRRAPSPLLGSWRLFGAARTAPSFDLPAWNRRADLVLFTVRSRESRSPVLQFGCAVFV